MKKKTTEPKVDTHLLNKIDKELLEFPATKELLRLLTVNVAGLVKLVNTDAVED